jgi:hypothetical protein
MPNLPDALERSWARATTAGFADAHQMALDGDYGALRVEARGGAV